MPIDMAGAFAWSAGGEFVAVALVERAYRVGWSRIVCHLVPASVRPDQSLIARARGASHRGAA